MGTMGLALPWEHRIPPVPHQPERRLDPFQNRVPDPAQNRPAIDPSIDAARAEDFALAEACRSGDMSGYERLYAQHGAKMKNLARNLLGSAVDAEDAVQETFMKVQRSIAGFRGQSSFVTWTFRILVNTCYDARRSRVRKKEVSTDDDTTESPLPEPRAPGGHPALRLALERALATLTRHQRDVFLLYEVEGFSHAEVADTLEISEAASKNTLFQAKKNLRQLLEAPRSGDVGRSR
jgi:RNA polymerase sigma-70 factor (ECF subfamily)